MAAATFGTFLTTFAVTINNHLPAAVCVGGGAVRCGADLVRRRAAAGATSPWPASSPRWRRPTSCRRCRCSPCSRPALLWKAPRPTLVAYRAGGARGGRPPLAPTRSPTTACGRPTRTAARPTRPTTGTTTPTSATARCATATGATRRAVDRGEPSLAVYALHALVGHHGIFSLTPIWLLSVWGLVPAVAARPRWPRAGRDDRRRCRWSAWRSTLTRPQDDRNYGGMTSGFRWMFWFAPLWLLAMLPAADRLATLARRPRPGPGAAGPLRAVGQLSDLESLDPSLAVELFVVSGPGRLSGYSTLDGMLVLGSFMITSPPDRENSARNTFSSRALGRKCTEPSM